MPGKNKKKESRKRKQKTCGGSSPRRNSRSRSDSVSPRKSRSVSPKSSRSVSNSPNKKKSKASFEDKMILKMLNLERYTEEKQLRIVKKYFNSEKLERFKGSVNSGSFKSRYNEMTINNLISTIDNIIPEIIDSLKGLSDEEKGEIQDNLSDIYLKLNVIMAKS